MEVFVRNLPNEATERQVKQYFRPIFAELNINVFHCLKPRNQGFAKITVRDRQLGQHFLDIHGQARQGRQGFETVKRQLYHMNRPVNCSQSYNAPDEYVLKSLEKEEKEKALTKRRHTSKVSATGNKQVRRIFSFSVVNCGAMDYVEHDLAFVPYYGQVRTGRLIFHRRFILVDFDPLTAAPAGQQMEIPYSSIQSLMTGKSSSPYVTLSLAEAPRFYEKTPESEIDLVNSLQQLGLKAAHNNRNVPTRRRTTAIDSSHQEIVANCLCYRFHVAPADIQPILALKRLPGYPDIVPWDMSVVTKPRFQSQMTQLNTALNANKYQTYPFELKFQLQRLAQNGYLAPYKVLQLMQMMKQTFLNPDTSSLTDAVRKIFYHIPFPGAGIEAWELSLQTLQNLLVEKYNNVLREKEYSVNLTAQYEQIASIHKATVTPAGTYLSGPEPEMKNRVLRKYSAFSSFFLQVTFADEDGEPMRYDRTSSLEGVYRERFKRVLEGHITIAGRPYEVSKFFFKLHRPQLTTNHSSLGSLIHRYGRRHVGLWRHLCGKELCVTQELLSKILETSLL